MFFTQDCFSQTLSVSPNPFSQSATIQFSLSSPDTVTLVVLNAVGQQIQTVFMDTVLSSRSYSVLLHGDSLANGVYYIKMRHGSASNAVKAIKQSETTSISEVPGMDSLTMYPNPVKDNIILSKTTATMKISVSDIAGKEWLVTVHQNEVDVSMLPSGVYFLHVQNGRSVVVNKFVKE
jgi:hypothetical protein